MLAHVAGMPLEEAALGLTPVAGLVLASAFAIGRRLRDVLR